MKSTRNTIDSFLREQYPYQAEISRKGGLKSNSGVWILGKYPILRQASIQYRHRKGSDRFARKGATLAEFDVSGKKVQVIGTHTQSMPQHGITRERQFMQVKKELADKFFTQDIPQLIAGDLNVNYSDNLEYPRMLDILQTSPAEFTGESYSWDGPSNDLGKHFFSTHQQTLDYILIREEQENIARLSAATILKPTRSTCVCKRNFYDLSDHHPVLSRLYLNP